MPKKEFEFGTINEAADNGLMTSLNYHCTGHQKVHFGAGLYLQKTVTHRFSGQNWWFYTNELEIYCRCTEQSVRVVGVQ